MMTIKKTLLKTLLIGSVFFLNQNSNAQSAEIGGMIGSSYYGGDLSTLSIESPRPSISAFFKYNFNHQATIRAHAQWGQYASNDKFSSKELNLKRNVAITGQVVEFSTIFEYNYLPLHNPKFRNFISPYLFGGIGLFSFSVESTSKEEVEVLDLQPCIPFGLGVKYVLNPMWTFNIEYGARKTFTDYLDGVSDKANNYQNGFYANNDWYHSLSVGLSYTFYGVKCPENQL